MADSVLEVRNLTTRFFTEDGQINAVESIDFTVDEGEVFGIVGESGSGKSVTALSLIDLVESPGEVVDGQIRYRNADLVEAVGDDHPDAVDGKYVDLMQLPSRIRRSLRGPSFATIFQDPMSSLNPSITVGKQIAEAVEVQRRATANPRATRSRTQGFGLGKFIVSSIAPGSSYVSEQSMQRAVELLELVGIPDPEERAREHPHQFSGGMLQRAMIAQALAGEPDVLVADEPTTALDVTIQAQITDLLRELQEERGMTILLITHNLGVIARMCDQVGVMYAGEIVERGSLTDVFDDPVHPYTKGLLGSIPDVGGATGRLDPIEGNVPSLRAEEMGDRCYFADRCPKAMDECVAERPAERAADPGTADHAVRCVLADTAYDEEKALDRAEADGGTDREASDE